MRPLVYHEAWAGYAFFGAFGAYTIAEGILQARTQTDERDPSRTWMVVGSLAGLALAFGLAERGARLPGPKWLPVAIGLGVIAAGAALRYWSVHTLGRFFTVTVGVAEDQRVVDTGPYAVLRHPSYTGMLLAYLGTGIALDSWLSAAAAVMPATLAVLYRIRHEEELLRTQLAPAYEGYQRRTKRLVPGVW